jgi:hypothetical protein
MRNTYNALGMRTSVLENGIYTGFTFDGMNVISEVSADNEQIALYQEQQEKRVKAGYINIIVQGIKRQSICEDNTILYLCCNQVS